MLSCIKIPKEVLCFLIIIVIISCNKEESILLEEIPVYEIRVDAKPPSEMFAELTSVVPRIVVAFPNPFVNVVTIYSGYVPEQINISDQNGRLKKFQPSSSDTSFDFSEAKPGVYYCEVLSNGIVVRLQIIKTEN
jgi:hypothetical protein